ncbi:MAG: AraC family transcriptional regulator [bacterium]|nr:AraC family transcriptional regulator [bacterium]
MENQFYKQRINQVIDYIEQNLHKKLTLNELAKESFFSKYHFHRIFKAVQGETLNSFIKRIKMERACRQIINDPKKSLTDIAFDLGFNSSANFSRDFNNYYNQSPSEIRKIKKIPFKKKEPINTYTDISFTGIDYIPDIRILYYRISTGYNPAIINAAFNELFAYSEKNKLLKSIDQFIGIGYDDPQYTPQNKCRYDACISIDDDTVITAAYPYNLKKIKGGKYAVFLFEGKGEEISSAWDTMFHQWVVQSQYIPDNKPHLEMYLPCARYKENIFKANLCLPIKPI